MSTSSETPFTIVRRDDLVPLCPHCDAELAEIYTKARGVGFVKGQTTIFFCPHCRKVLGLGQNRMI